MSRAERRALVRRAHPELSVSRQGRLLSVGRSSLYYTTRGESEETLALMRRIDALFLKHPFYGTRQMVRHLRREGVRIGRRRAGRLMRLLGGVVARIVPGPHDAHRQDPHWPMRYDTGRPSSVIRLRISQPRTTSLPCPAGLRARRPSPMMDL